MQILPVHSDRNWPHHKAAPPSMSASMVCHPALLRLEHVVIVRGSRHHTKPDTRSNHSMQKAGNPMGRKAQLLLGVHDRRMWDWALVFDTSEMCTACTHSSLPNRSNRSRPFPRKGFRYNPASLQCCRSKGCHQQLRVSGYALFSSANLLLRTSSRRESKATMTSSYNPVSQQRLRNSWSHLARACRNKFCHQTAETYLFVALGTSAHDERYTLSMASTCSTRNQQACCTASDRLWYQPADHCKAFSCCCSAEQPFGGSKDQRKWELPSQPMERRCMGVASLLYKALCHYKPFAPLPCRSMTYWKVPS